MQDVNLNKEHANAAVMLQDLYSQSHSDQQAFPSDQFVSTNKGGCASGGCQEAERSVLMTAKMSDNPLEVFFLLFIYVVIIHKWSLISVFYEPVENILIIFSRTPICSFTENMNSSQYFGCFSGRNRKRLTLKLCLIDFFPPQQTRIFGAFICFKVIVTRASYSSV